MAEFHDMTYAKTGFGHKMAFRWTEYGADHDNLVCMRRMGDYCCQGSYTELDYQRAKSYVYMILFSSREGCN